MIALTADESARWAAVGGRQVWLRVDVADSTAIMRDLTVYPGQNLVVSAQWSDSLDNNGVAGTVTLKREIAQLSLAPLMQGSPLNRAFAYPGSYAPLLELKRKIQIRTAIMATDQVPSAADFVVRAEGLIDSIDWGQTENVSLAFSDHQGELRDAFIETERIYNYADPTDPDSTKGLLVWTPLTTIALNDLGSPSDANRNGHFYKATSIAGGTGSAEPTWPLGSGSTVVDNGVTWTEVGTTTTTVGTDLEVCLQQLLNDNGQGGYTLNTPASPGWKVKFYLQSRVALWDAMRALVDQLGWDLRFKWDAGSSTFKLTLWTPNRAKTTPDFSFVVTDVFDSTKVVLDIADVRNVVKGIYSDSANLDASGTPLRVPYTSTNATSVARYGRRYMEIDEASTANIDTAGEMQTMCDNCVADLCNPTAEQDVPVPYFPWAEVGDLFQFSADGIHYDASQKLACHGWAHSVDETGATTKLIMRGTLPTSGKDRWLAMQGDVTGDGTHKMVSNNIGALTLSTSSVVGGARLQVAATMSKRALGNGYEYHVGTTSNFVPSAATLIAAGENTHADAPHLIPSKRYYFKAIVRGRNEGKHVRSGASAAVAFDAGQASAGHLTDGIALGEYPLNGGFETRLDAAGMPDHWIITPASGVLGTDFIVMEDGNGLSGGRYMRVVSQAGFTQIQSAEIPLTNDAADGTTRGTTRYRISAWVKTKATNSGANNLFIAAQGVDYTGALIGAMGSSGVTFVNAASHLGNWQRVSAVIHSDGFTAMRGVIVYVFQDTTGVVGSTYDVDEIRVQSLGTPWYAVGAGGVTDNMQSVPGFTNSWANFGSSYTPARFRKDATGRVWVEGLVHAGTLAAAMFTLPLGYRPSSSAWLYVDGTNQIDVRDNGNVICQGASNTHVWIGFNFMPDFA